MLRETAGIIRGIKKLNAKHSLQEGSGQHHKKCCQKPGCYFLGDPRTAHLPVGVDAQRAEYAEQAGQYQRTIPC